jgi:hypothetical protein
VPSQGVLLGWLHCVVGGRLEWAGRDGVGVGRWSSATALPSRGVSLIGANPLKSIETPSCLFTVSWATPRRGQNLLGPELLGFAWGSKWRQLCFPSVHAWLSTGLSERFPQAAVLWLLIHGAWCLPAFLARWLGLDLVLRLKGLLLDAFCWELFASTTAFGQVFYQQLVAGLPALTHFSWLIPL